MSILIHSRIIVFTVSLNSTPVITSSFSSDVNAYCNKTGVQITEITWDVVATRGYSYEIMEKGLVSRKIKGKRTFPSSLFLSFED